MAATVATVAPGAGEITPPATTDARVTADSPSERAPPPVEAAPEERVKWADIDVGDDDVSAVFAAPATPPMVPPTAAQETAYQQQVPPSSACESEEEPKETPIVLSPKEIQFLASIPLEQDIVAISADRTRWSETRAQRVAFLMRAAKRAEAQDSTDAQIDAYHEIALATDETHRAKRGLVVASSVAHGDRGCQLCEAQLRDSRP